MRKISMAKVPPELRVGAEEVCPLLGLEPAGDGLTLEAVSGAEKLVVSLENGRARIAFSRPAEFCRGLGILAEHIGSGSFRTEEIRAYRSLGAMYDCSRNGVLKPEAVKCLLRILAVMGYDTLMLYTEDTYEVEGYPYFGHLRGRYTAEEIQECDRYAAALGIELVPCIQTLAHLNGAFKWEQFREINDCDDILLAGEEKTYALIDAMLRSVSGMYRSRRVNIGMDEAHMVGLGKYLDRHGFQKRFDIMTAHLRHVLALCEKYGLRPQMWSDMFFRLLFSGYYNTEAIDPALLEQVPAGVELAYWDYYSTEKKCYDKNLENHLKFPNEIVFAGGAWKWMGFVPNNQWSFYTSRMALESCREHGIRQVIATGWGDDGAECSSFASLPVMQLFAEDCYEQNTEDDFLAKRFSACTQGCMEDFMGLDRPNFLKGNEAPGGCSVNPSKYLFYQDVLCGLFEAHTEIGACNAYYRNLGAEYDEAAARNPGYSALFRTCAAFCRVLELKCDIGLRLKKAYAARDSDALRRLAERDLTELLARVEEFHGLFRRQWEQENKPFGFDVQDIRLGGLKERIRAAKRRVEGYLSGAYGSIEELEQPALDYWCRTEAEAAAAPQYSANVWGNIATPNRLW